MDMMATAADLNYSAKDADLSSSSRKPTARKRWPVALLAAFGVGAAVALLEGAKPVLLANVPSPVSQWLTMACGALAAAVVVSAVFRKREGVEKELRYQLHRHAAEVRELRELKRQYERIFDSISEGIHWIDRDRRIVFENRAAATMLGWELSELIGKPAHETMHHTRADGSPHPACECRILKTIQTGRPCHGKDEVFWRKDGSCFPVEYTSTAVRDGAGEIAGALVVFTDASVRKRVENENRQRTQELAAERSRFHEILNTIPAVVFENSQAEGDAEPRLFVSKYVEEMLGFTTAEFMATRDFWFSRVHPEDRARVSAETGRLFSGQGEVSKSVFRWLARDGRVVWGETHLAVIRAKTGRVIGVRGVTFDVGERVRMDEELRWKTAFLEAQTEASLDGILVVNEKRETLLKNGRMLDVWQMPPHFREGADDLTMLQAAVAMTKYPDRFLQRVEELYARPTEISRDEIELKDGRSLDRYSSPVFGPTGTYYGRIWTFRDITERKRAEAEKEILHRQLVQLSRHAGMAEVASNVLHNVGNVLNSINTSIELATDKVQRLKTQGLARVATLLGEHAGNLPEFVAQHPQGVRLPQFLAQLAAHFSAEQGTVLEELASLRNNLEHVNQIVSMQQSYAISGGIIEVLPLSEVIEDALRMNTGAFERHGVCVRREFDTSLPPVALDRNKLLLILVNLVRNAKYACDESGRSEKQIVLRTERTGKDRVTLSVRDNGVGVAPENLTRIFQHGFTTRKGGHGFGLHSSALAAREMGGSLGIHSEGPGCGATFTVELPLCFEAL